MISELKTIWKLCFNDRDEYIDFYFARRYRPENTLEHYEDGRTVAMMTMLPVTVVTDYVELQARYVYAVATLPEYQGRGIASQMAMQADRQMKAGGNSLAVVVPASESLFAFYGRQGFSTAFFRRVVTFPMGDIETIDTHVRTTVTPFDDEEKLYALREHYFARCGFFVRWDRKALRYAIDECRLSGGELLYVSDGCDEGYLFVEPNEAENMVRITEAALTPALAPATLSFLKTRYARHEKLEFRLSVDSPLWEGEGESEPVAMLKWFVHPPQGVITDRAYINLLKD